jgi:hypothetical protein
MRSPANVLGLQIKNSGYDSTVWAPPSGAVSESRREFIRIAPPPVATCYLPHLTRHPFESI